MTIVSRTHRYAGYKSISKYREKPTYMATRVVEQGQVDFPSVTICPEARMGQEYDLWYFMSKFEMRLIRNTAAAKSIRYTFRPSKPEYCNVTELVHPKLGKCFGIVPAKRFTDAGIYYIRIY